MILFKEIGNRTKQCPLSLSLPGKLLCSNIALLEGDSAVFDFEGADIAVAVEPLYSCQLLCYFHESCPNHFAYWIILNEGGKLGIWHHSVECAIDIIWDLAVYFQVLYFSLHPAWLHKP
jgi:hypothetical protein